MLRTEMRLLEEKVRIKDFVPLLEGKQGNDLLLLSLSTAPRTQARHCEPTLWKPGSQSHNTVGS